MNLCRMPDKITSVRRAHDHNEPTTTTSQWRNENEKIAFDFGCRCYCCWIVLFSISEKVMRHGATSITQYGLPCAADYIASERCFRLSQQQQQHQKKRVWRSSTILLYCRSHHSIGWLCEDGSLNSKWWRHTQFTTSVRREMAMPLPFRHLFFVLMKPEMDIVQQFLRYSGFSSMFLECWRSYCRAQNNISSQQKICSVESLFVYLCLSEPLWKHEMKYFDFKTHPSNQNFHFFFVRFLNIK